MRRNCSKTPSISLKELGRAELLSDLSYLSRPSIARAHEQNNDYRDWTVLIDIARDGWAATAEECPERACRQAQRWLRIEYPLFKRLAFFAAAQGETVKANQALRWLLMDDAWWLWSIETQRESMRLLASLAPRLNDSDLRRLVAKILKGPPRGMYRPDLQPAEWSERVDREVWIRLQTLSDENVELGPDAEKG